MKYLNKITTLGLCFILALGNAFSQEITVRDSKTSSPLSNVYIYNESKTKSIITNDQGQASLSNFSSDEKVYFQLLGYTLLELQLSEFLNNSFDLYLDSESQNLDEVILSVARSESNANEIAEKVSVIKAEDLYLTAPSSGAEMLELSPGIRIQKSQGGGGSPVIRGFEANRVLIVVDGVRMNNAIYRSGHLQNSITIDPNNIDRVEIIYGSSSVGYGSDALGGVVHYYTKNPTIKDSIKIKSSFSSNYNTANSSISNSFSTNYSEETWGMFSTISISKFGNIKMGERREHGYQSWGLNNYYSENSRYNFKDQPSYNEEPNLQQNTDYSQVDFFQKFLFKLPYQNLLNLNIQYSESSDIDRYDKLSEEKNGELKFSEWYYGPQKRLLISPSLKFFSQNPLLKRGRITLAYQMVQESRINRKFSSLIRSSQLEKVNLFSLNGDFDTSFDNGHAVSYGIEGTVNRVTSNAYSQNIVINGNEISNLGPKTNIPTRYPSDGSSYKSFAMYVNWTWNMNDFFTFNAGTRLTYTGLRASWKESASINAQLSNVKLNSSALTTTLSMTLRPSKKFQVMTVLSSGFRNPNIDDIGKIRENNGILVVPNTFLKPEYAYNLDLGINYKSLNELTYLSLRTFATVISRHIVRDDFIIFSDNTTPDESTILYNGEEVTTIANKNLGNRFIHGYSIDGFSYFSRSLKLNGSLSYVKGDENETYGPMPSISPIFGTISGEYTKDKIKISALYKFSGDKSPKDYSLGGEDGLEETPVITENSNGIIYAGTPKWSDFSIYTNYDISEDVKIRIALTNIFDNHYRTFASGISAPGRSFQIGLYLKL
jgi:hemoglobin/transferrin/lactoferrin receptor protein